MIDLLIGRLNNFILTGLTSLVQNISEIKYCEWNRPFFQKVFVEFDLSFRFVVEYMQSKYRTTK